MEINKERFEAWLFAQPDNRTWDYKNGHGCVACYFLIENVKVNGVSVGHEDFTVGYNNKRQLPKFLIKLFSPLRTKNTQEIVSAEWLKHRWKHLFPEPQPIHEQKQQTPCGAAPEGMQEKRPLADSRL